MANASARSGSLTLSPIKSQEPVVLKSKELQKENGRMLPGIPDGGKFLKEMRENAGIAQKELAAWLNWDAKKLSKYENGELTTPYSVLEVVADAIQDVGKGDAQELVFLALMKCLFARNPGLKEHRLGQLLIELQQGLQDR